MLRKPTRKRPKACATSVMRSMCNLKQIYALEVEEHLDLGYSEDDESSGNLEQILELAEQTEHMKILVHVLNRSMGFKFVRVTVYNAKEPLHILIDTGSIHNFINSDLAEMSCNNHLSSYSYCCKW